MQIDILSLFPDAFASFMDQPPVRSAIQDRLVEIRVHNFGLWIDEGGSVLINRSTDFGRTRLICAEPVVSCMKSVRLPQGLSRTIVLSPAGRCFDQEMAREMSGLDQLVLVCGRFGGFEDGLAQRIQAEEISVGNYVLTGGELAAMIVTDCVARQIPGVISGPAALS